MSKRAWIIRKADAAIMDTFDSVEAAEKDMRLRDSRGQWLTVVSADTHRHAIVDGYSLAVPLEPVAPVESAPVALICGECGIGHYYATGEPFTYGCKECDHTISLEDVDLDDAETIAHAADGALAYIPA
jgi:hypothetical protein